MIDLMVCGVVTTRLTQFLVGKYMNIILGERVLLLLSWMMTN